MQSEITYNYEHFKITPKIPNKK